MAASTRAMEAAAPRLRDAGRLAVQPLPLASDDDATLARAIARGHPTAPQAAFRRFAPLVRGLLTRVLGPIDDLEDHVQETFLRLFEHAHDLRQPDLLTSFVVGIALRVARSELRRRRLRRWLSLTPTGRLPDLPSAGSDMTAREAVGRLYAILDRLDDRARLAFVLRYFEGLELTEVAKMLGCSLATAKRRLERASDRVLQLAKRDPALAAYAVNEATIRSLELRESSSRDHAHDPRHARAPGAAEGTDPVRGGTHESGA